MTDWQGHCDRLRHSIHCFDWVEPDWKRVQRGAIALLPDYSVLRITVFPDGRELITGRQLPSDLENRQQNGITAWIAEGPRYQRWMPEHKTGNYLPCWMALRDARHQGAQEAILTNSVGEWLETSTGNLWGWQDGQWWTPPLSAGILPGLARSHLSQWLISQGHSITEEAWTLDRVARFEAIAYSNSVVEIVPVHTVLRNGEKLSYDPHHQAFEILWALYAHWRDASS